MPEPLQEPLLRRRDQATIAVLTAVGLLGIALWWQQSGGQQLIEIDRAAPLTYQFQVDLNQAEWPELAQLPDIGPVLAKRIVASRQNEGPYRASSDLMRVNGIGPRKLAKIKKYLATLPDDAMVAGR